MKIIGGNYDGLCGYYEGFLENEYAGHVVQLEGTAPYDPPVRVHQVEAVFKD